VNPQKTRRGRGLSREIPYFKNRGGTHSEGNSTRRGRGKSERARASLYQSEPVKQKTSRRVNRVNKVEEGVGGRVAAQVLSEAGKKDQKRYLVRRLWLVRV